MQKEKILDQYFPETKDQILQAIQFHNRAELPTDIPSNVLLLAKIIRDADKLDILRFFVEYYTSKRDFQTIIDIELPDIPEISPDIIDSIQNDRFVKLSSIKTMNDFKLMQFRWVFEFNFTPSLRILRDKRYIEQIYATLPSNPFIQSYYIQILNQLNNKCVN